MLKNVTILELSSCSVWKENDFIPLWHATNYLLNKNFQRSYDCELVVFRVAQYEAKGSTFTTTIAEPRISGDNGYLISWPMGWLNFILFVKSEIFSVIHLADHCSITCIVLLIIEVKALFLFDENMPQKRIRVLFQFLYTLVRRFWN